MLLILATFLLHWVTWEPFRCLPDDADPMALNKCSIPAVVNPQMPVDHFRSFETVDAALDYLNARPSLTTSSTFKGLYQLVPVVLAEVPDGVTTEIRKVAVEVKKTKFVVKKK